MKKGEQGNPLFPARSPFAVGGGGHWGGGRRAESLQRRRRHSQPASRRVTFCGETAAQFSKLFFQVPGFFRIGTTRSVSIGRSSNVPRFRNWNSLRARISLPRVGYEQSTPRLSSRQSLGTHNPPPWRIEASPNFRRDEEESEGMARARR